MRDIFELPILLLALSKPDVIQSPPIRPELLKEVLESPRAYVPCKTGIPGSQSEVNLNDGSRIPWLGEFLPDSVLVEAHSFVPSPPQAQAKQDVMGHRIISHSPGITCTDSSPSIRATQNNILKDMEFVTLKAFLVLARSSSSEGLYERIDLL
ncbi:hypothetical protein AOQ84DRAFT_393166 [Glonium stellatum]|uniref:Uncharacterized protein n=1 Tax=Glonium stellatum TaxID=574774 RepID=A0A8E2JMG4_9PEZI|nr:hypothetical protein AOQ84DRAFT_393166 [Glonium stellatum]